MGAESAERDTGSPDREQMGCPDCGGGGCGTCGGDGSVPAWLADPAVTGPETARWWGWPG